ncbi:MAG: (Fe-S)-binding protein [Planctomycetota bacterium]
MAKETKYSYYVENGTLEVTDRPRKFLEAFAAVLDHGNYSVALETYSRLSAKCARCVSSCQLYETTEDDQDIPCHRSELLMRVYRRYFTQAGMLKARLFGGFTLTDDYVDEMAETYYRCTACRRCKATCPIGIDHGLITHLARWLLAEVNVIPKALVVAVREQLEGVGNTSAITVPGLKDFPAVSDYLLEADTLMGNAAVLQATGGSWTIGTGNFDGINYGLFYSDRMMERIVNNVVAEVRRLKGRKILVGECGHATRAAWYVDTFGGPDAPPVVHCMQYAHEMLKTGKLRLRDKRIEERVTYHDPCNIARTGRITEEPRDLLKAICTDFVEMTPNRTENLCCGGGGGTVSIDEIREFRTKLMGKRKADQIRATGAQYVVSPCANCKKQLREVCEDNGLEDVEVVGLHDLLLKVLDFGTPPQEEEEASRGEQSEIENEDDTEDKTPEGAAVKIADAEAGSERR